MNKRKDIRGVTLIEILVTLVIAGILMAAVWEIYLSIQKQGGAQDEITDMQQNVRIATDQITKELRSAGYNTTATSSDNPQRPIGIIGSACSPPDNTLSPTCSQKTLSKDYPNNFVTIRGDFDGNGISEEVTYKVNTSSTLTRCYKVSDTSSCQDEDFVPNIQSVVFSFYNDQNASVTVNTSTTGQNSAARRVSVLITAMTKQYDPATPIGKLWSSSPNLNSPTKYKTAQLTSDTVIRNFGTTASDTTPPACPTSIAVTATHNCGELQVTWSWAGTDTDLGGFLVYYQASNGLDTGTLTVADPNARSVFLQKRQNNATYSVDVRAYDRYFNKNPTCASPFPTATPDNTLGTPPGAPGIPANLQATPGNNQVTLSWNPIDTTINYNRDLKGYRLYRDTTSNFTPGTSNMIACERLTATNGPVTGCPAGKNLLSAPDATEGWSSVTSFVDTTAANCTKYYYKVRAVDWCTVESSDSITVNATPPDNDKAPNTPIITSLVAGDDTSSIIVNWTLNYNPADTTHSAPDRFKVFRRNVSIGQQTWDQWGADIPITLTGSPQTLTGQAILNGLLTNTLYEVKVSVYDSASLCSNEAFDTGTISTAACAPKITWGGRGGHFIYPGITTTGTPLANFSTVGTDPGTVANSRFITWIADPLDCTPDSSNYDRPGFDYNNPPAYTIVSPGAQVEFYINNLGGPNIAANIPYNFTGITQFVDPAPRSSDGYYHWPVFPLVNTHIDTTRLCNGFKEFKIRAVDGEAYTAENSIILDIENGGIVSNSSQAITNITTPNDFHNQVIFGLRNSSTVKDLRITKMQLSWGNFPAAVFLKKIEVFDSINTLIGLFDDTILPIDTASGTEVTLTTIPSIPIGSTVTVKVTFTISDGSVPSTADMRGRTFSVGSVSSQDNTDPGFNCSATGPGFSLSSEPVAGSVVQDKPVPGTTAKTAPDPNLTVAANSSVKVSLPVTDLSSSISSVKIRYAVDTIGLSTAPTRPSNITDLGNYPNIVAMTFDQTTSLWNGTIAANNNSRIWYFITAQDAIGNLDITPDQGAYTYSECGTTSPTVVFNSPPTPAPGNVNNNVTVQVTVTSTIAISNVFLFTDPATSALVVPPTPMTQVSPGVWQGSYNATAGNLHHELKVTATDTCGNQTTIGPRIYN